MRDDYAPAWWTLADAYGNEIDVSTSAYRDEPPPEKLIRQFLQTVVRLWRADRAALSDFSGDGDEHDDDGQAGDEAGYDHVAAEWASHDQRRRDVALPSP